MIRVRRERAGDRVQKSGHASQFSIDSKESHSSVIAATSMSPAGAGHQPIPVVEFSVVDSTVLIPPRCDNPQAIAFGFNDGTPWKVGTDAPATDPATGGEDDPNRYIRYLRKLPSNPSRFDNNTLRNEQAINSPRARKQLAAAQHHTRAHTAYNLEATSNMDLYHIVLTCSELTRNTIRYALYRTHGGRLGKTGRVRHGRTR